MAEMKETNKMEWNPPQIKNLEISEGTESDYGSVSDGPASS
jgi:hypothetical protein